jgi:hypothetical protein
MRQEEAEDSVVLLAGLRAFFDVPSKLWADLLAALRIVPYPLAREVHRAVDVAERAANYFHEDLRVFLGLIGVFLGLIGVVIGFIGVVIGFLVWRELRRR